MFYVFSVAVPFKDRQNAAMLSHSRTWSAWTKKLKSCDLVNELE